MSASRPQSTEYVKEWRKELEKLGWWHSFTLPDGSLIKGVSSLDSQERRIGQFPIPRDLTGKRVLDIGTWDGWFAFEMERRGAEVTAIDCWDNPRFREMHKIYRSRIDYRQMDVMEVAPETVGRFDIVVFMGVFYHLKHPLMALEKVCSVTRELAVVESYVLRDNLDPNARPAMEFYEADEMGGQTDNWCGPNVACLMAMCRTAGFARVELAEILPNGAGLTCFRQWEPERNGGPRVDLVDAIHNPNNGINFDTRRDEYVTCFFKTPARALKLEDIQPRVEDYGVRPIHAAHLQDDLWQMNFKLPPGLTPGWHEMTIGVQGGPRGNSHRIAVDLPIPDCTLKIESIQDGVKWTEGVLDLSAGRVLSLWASGLPENADRNNVQVLVNGIRWATEFVGNGPRQVNARAPERVSPGDAEVTLKIGNCASPSVVLRVIGS